MDIISYNYSQAVNSLTIWVSESALAKWIISQKMKRNEEWWFIGQWVSKFSLALSTKKVSAEKESYATVVFHLENFAFSSNLNAQLIRSLVIRCQ